MLDSVLPAMICRVYSVQLSQLRQYVNRQRLIVILDRNAVLDHCGPLCGVIKLILALSSSRRNKDNLAFDLYLARLPNVCVCKYICYLSL